MMRSNKNIFIHGEFILLLSGGFSERLKHLVPFSVFVIKQKSKTKKQDCMQTFFPAIDNSVRQLA